MSGFLDPLLHAALRAFTRLFGNGTTTPEPLPEPLSEALPETPAPRFATSASNNSVNNRTAACSRSGVSGRRRGGNNLNSFCFGMPWSGPAEEPGNPLVRSKTPASSSQDFKAAPATSRATTKDPVSSERLLPP